MPTNEERREVAKKLSGYNPEWLSLRNLSKETIVNYCLLWRALEESFPEINEHVHDISDKLYNLGKLIEPEPERTCRNLGKFGGFKCSECGFEEKQLTEMEEEPQDWDYCPNCGANVIEEETCR